MLQSLPWGISRSQKHKRTTQRNNNATQQKVKHHAPCNMQRQIKRQRTTVTAQQGHAPRSAQRQLSRPRTIPTTQQGSSPQYARGSNPHRTKRATRMRADGSPREDGCRSPTLAGTGNSDQQRAPNTQSARNRTSRTKRAPTREGLNRGPASPRSDSCACRRIPNAKQTTKPQA